MPKIRLTVCYNKFKKNISNEVLLMATTLLFYSLKSNVGKTTISVIAADHLSRLNKRVLLVDLDAQASATRIMEKSYREIPIKIALRKSLNKNTLEKSIVNLDQNLDIIPSDSSIGIWEHDLEKLPKYDNDLVLTKDLEPLQSSYDYIIIDVPSTPSLLVNNAVLASDYLALILQTQRSSYESLLNAISYLSQLQKDHVEESKFDLAGIILYPSQSMSKTYLDIQKQVERIFGSSMLVNKVYYKNRVKYWTAHGITYKQSDVQDRRTHRMYSLVLYELLDRIENNDNTSEILVDKSGSNSLLRQLNKKAENEIDKYRGNNKTVRVSESAYKTLKKLSFYSGNQIQEIINTLLRYGLQHEPAYSKLLHEVEEAESEKKNSR